MRDSYKIGEKGTGKRESLGVVGSKMLQIEGIFSPVPEDVPLHTHGGEKTTGYQQQGPGREKTGVTTGYLPGRENAHTGERKTDVTRGEKQV